MNLVDQLLKADAKKVNDLETGVYKSKKLAKVLGKGEAVEITVREIPSRRLNELVAFQLDKNGNVDFSKTYDTKLMVCLEGIVEPSMRNKDLQEHFGAKTGTDLIEKLFGSEVNEISDAISALSGLTGNEEEEIKN
jgi:hypothetical protein